MVKLVSHVRIDTDQFDFVQDFADADFSDQAPEGFTATFSPGDFAELGALPGFEYSYNNGSPFDGTTESVDLFINNRLVVEISGLHLTVQDFAIYANLTVPQIVADVLNSFDMIVGSSKRDVINGYSGNDFLNGSGGRDTLYGSHGTDTFYFDKKGAAHHDQIRDFGTGGIRDVIGLDSAAFSRVGRRLTESEFEQTNAAFRGVDAQDNILYIKRTGQLYYDPDGRGNVGANPKLFAEVGNNTNLVYKNFVVIREADLLDA